MQHSASTCENHALGRPWSPRLNCSLILLVWVHTVDFKQDMGVTSSEPQSLSSVLSKWYDSTCALLVSEAISPALLVCLHASQQSTVALHTQLSCRWIRATSCSSVAVPSTTWNASWLTELIVPPSASTILSGMPDLSLVNYKACLPCSRPCYVMEAGKHQL